MVLDVAIFFERVRHLGNTMRDEVRRVMVSFTLARVLGECKLSEPGGRTLGGVERLVKRGHISVITNTRTR